MDLLRTGAATDRGSRYEVSKIRRSYRRESIPRKDRRYQKSYHWYLHEVQNLPDLIESSILTIPDCFLTEISFGDILKLLKSVGSGVIGSNSTSCEPRVRREGLELHEYWWCQKSRKICLIGDLLTRETVRLKKSTASCSVRVEWSVKLNNQRFGRQSLR